MKVTKAIIPAAGRGTRLLPATKVQPKEMLPIYDTPLIQFVVEEAMLSGIEDILIITGKGKRSIEDHFDISANSSDELCELNELISKVNILYTRQSEPKGLGDAILHAKSFVGNEPFAVLLGDDFYIDCKIPATKQLLEQYQHLDDGSALVGVEILSRESITTKGMVVVDDSSQPYRITDLIEKPAIDKIVSDLAISGRYILPSQIFGAIEGTEPGYGGEIQLTDAMKTLLNSGHPFYANKIAGTRIDIGNPMTYLMANIQFAMSRDGIRNELEQFLTNLLKQQ